MAVDQDVYGLHSPGGFAFGIQGFMWGEPRPTTLTFFLDGTVKVCDQHGRAIRGIMTDGKKVQFAMTPPVAERDGTVVARPQYANHAEVIAALASERIDWQKLTCAGFPQLPYEQLSRITQLPATPDEELARIPDPSLRRDARRAQHERLTAKRQEAALKEEDSRPG